MSYLISEDFESICNTVKIYPISSKAVKDISQYSFDCGKAKEYETFLKKKALLLEELGITRTFLIVHSVTNELIGYYSLSADTVRLTIDEKIGTDLESVACRFVTVDADIEYYENTPEFYIKNGFVENQSKKRRITDKTISMRRDIFQ